MPAVLVGACGPSAPATTAGETDGTSETGSETGTTTSSWLPDHPPQPESCDPFMQNCPAGEKCVPYASSGGNWDANKCVPVLGEQTTGEPGEAPANQQDAGMCVLP